MNPTNGVNDGDGRRGAHPAFVEGAMIIASRTLVLTRNGHKTEIPVRLHTPESGKVDWICRFDIGWPDGKVERWGAGVDAI